MVRRVIDAASRGVVVDRCRAAAPSDEPRSDPRVTEDTDPPTVRRPAATPPLLTQAERDASLDAMLVDWRCDDPVWVFAYGSLIWRPDFTSDARVRGRVHGFHRSLCLWSQVYRGTPDRPGLVLGLEPGGSVHGVAFRIPAPLVRRELQALWSRELVTGSYVPRWLPVRLETGMRVAAIGFVMDRADPGYAGELDDATLLETVRTASGCNGSCADYVKSTVESLAAYRIHDRHLNALVQRLAGRDAPLIDSA